MADNSREVKLVLLGDVGVGKSSIVHRFAENVFDKYTESTIGAAFMSKMIMVDDKPVKFQIWDTAGQEKYKSLAPMYYRNAAAAIVVYDITRADTFERVQDWVSELHQNGPDKIVIAVAGNKCDLQDQRAVETVTGRDFAENIGAAFEETSAKTSENVKALFEHISRMLPEEAPTGGIGSGDPNALSLEENVEFDQAGARGGGKRSKGGGKCC